MKPYNGGRRTRIRTMRADHDKRRFKSANGETTPSGKTIVEKLTRDKPEQIEEFEKNN